MEPSLTEYDPARYGRVVGNDYDALYSGDPAETTATATLLAELARERPEQSVLEFGIGTGRVGLELHRMGIRIAGIDGSPQMVAQLREKAHGDEVVVSIGDYRTTRLPESFSVVALLWNGILDPRGREAQLDIFRNAAAHLRVGGCFVVESFVLCDAERSGNWSVFPRYVGVDHVELQFLRYDIETNAVERTLVHLRPEGLNFVTVKDTYASPHELDLVAEQAGFRRRARFGGWSRETFTNRSRKHVSVYELTTGP